MDWHTICVHILDPRTRTLCSPNVWIWAVPPSHWASRRAPWQLEMARKIHGFVQRWSIPQTQHFVIREIIINHFDRTPDHLEMLDRSGPAGPSFHQGIEGEIERKTGKTFCPPGGKKMTVAWPWHAMAYGVQYLKSLDGEVFSTLKNALVYIVDTIWIKNTWKSLLNFNRSNNDWFMQSWHYQNWPNILGQDSCKPILFDQLVLDSARWWHCDRLGLHWWCRDAISEQVAWWWNNGFVWQWRTPNSDGLSPFTHESRHFWVWPILGHRPMASK